MTKKKYTSNGRLDVSSSTMTFLTDHQARFVDWETHQSVLKFLKDFRPETIIVGGDLIDAESLSKFPTSLEGRQTLMDDIEAGRKVLADYRKACPKARIIWVFGNHCARLQRFLRNNAPELENLESLRLEELVGTKELNVEVLNEYGDGVNWHDMYAFHGTKTSKHSAYSAKAEFEDEGGSGMSGHTHRIGVHIRTDRAGTHGWYEGGCLCRVDPKGAPPSFRGPRQNNWSQGLLVGYAQDGIWNVYPVVITEHKFIWNGKLYQPDEKTTIQRGRGRPKKEDK